MLGYTTIGVKDIDAAKKFYAELLGAKVLVDVGRLAMIGKSTDEPMIAVCKPYNGQDPHPGNGVMVAFRGGSQEGAAALYHKALSLGATCEGEPGSRFKDVFYAGYVKDPDGNKLCFFDFS